VRLRAVSRSWRSARISRYHFLIGDQDLVAAAAQEVVPQRAQQAALGLEGDVDGLDSRLRPDRRRVREAGTPAGSGSAHNVGTRRGLTAGPDVEGALAPITSGAPLWAVAVLTLWAFGAVNVAADDTGVALDQLIPTLPAVIHVTTPAPHEGAAPA
jgi:hypothetical protein